METGNKTVNEVNYRHTRAVGNYWAKSCEEIYQMPDEGKRTGSILSQIVGQSIGTAFPTTLRRLATSYDLAMFTLGQFDRHNVKL
jgi:hypothetical protein